MGGGRGTDAADLGRQRRHALRVAGLVVVVALIGLVVLLSLAVGAKHIPPGVAWPVWQIQISDLIGKKAEAKALKKKYDDRAAQIRNTYADKLAKTKFALVNAGGGKWYLNLEGSWGGTILKDLGAQFARGGVTDPNMNTPDFSIEQLDKLDEADVILYQADYQGKAGADTQVIIDLPAYQNLKATRAGKSLPTGNFYALHYKAAMAFQDEIEKILKGA